MMQKIIFIAIAGAISLSAVPVAAQEGSAVADQAKSPPDEKMVCKRFNKPNSRVTQKDCRTAKEWRQRKADNRVAIETGRDRQLLTRCHVVNAGTREVRCD